MFFTSFSTVFFTSFSSVFVLSKSGVAAFFRDVTCVLLHNKSLAFTVVVGCVVVCAGTILDISGLVIDGIALAVLVTLGVFVTIGVVVLQPCVA